METPETDQNPCPEDTDCFQSEVARNFQTVSVNTYSEK
jgi:hypothetical protein